MFGKTKIAFLVAIVLGVLGAASAALAGDAHDDGASGARAARKANEDSLRWRWNSSGVGRGAFAYQPPKPTARPLTSFERNWFHYQDCPGTEGDC
jgi:hypothetical protein